MNKLSQPNDTAPSVLERAASAAPTRALIAGASGGIGQAFCQQLTEYYPDIEIIRMARKPEALPALANSILELAFDLTDEQSLQQATQQIATDQLPDWVFIATGWLHNDNQMPEKTFRSLDAEHLLQSYALNAIGPALLVKALLQHIPKSQPLNIGVLSARVGSISDNRLGGWHSYRASKAALNMLIKNFSLELARQKRPVIITGLQPGTTATGLSKPFQRNVKPEDLQTPEYTASQLIRVMSKLQPEDSGELFDFLGIRFAP
ncbi:MAG: SDR family NAD(P)-dependent oxidoreductase [Thiolinea sp.]